MVVLGRTYERLDKNDLALQIYEKAVSMPDCASVSAYFYLGVLLDKLKQSERAI